MGTKISISDLSTIDAAALAPLNQALDDLADEFDKVVYRDGTTPSQLTADLDANSNKIVNLGAPVNNSDAVRLQDVTDDAKTAKASAVTIDDSAGDFASDNVEGALGELGDLTALTTAEIDQLENIDTVTISNTQWGYVGSLDQSLATTDAVAFATVDTGQGANELYAMDQDVKTTDTVTFAGNDPEHATDSATDTYDSATNTTVPDDGVVITRDFQSANTTTTPTLDGKTMTDRDGSALWAGAVSRVHDVQYDSGADTYLVLEPREIRVRTVGVLARHQNLTIHNNSGTPNSQVDIDADELEVYDANGIPHVLTSVDLTVDITASGANGLDTGAEASSTWYHLWVIYNGTTIAGLLSTASSFGSLTLPSGYTYAGYVGAVFNDGSSDFLRFWQRNSIVAVTEQVDLSNGSATSATSVSVTVPTTASSLICRLAATDNAGSSGLREIRVFSKSSATRPGGTRVGSHVAASFETFGGGEIPLIEDQTVYYEVNTSSCDGDIVTTGWRF